MKVRLIDTDTKSDLKKFIQLPFDLYRNNPYWVPQMRSDTRFMLDHNSYPFYQHSAADFFIAENNGKTVGRIGVISNNRYNKTNQLNTVFFYIFDSIDDSNVSNALFKSIFNWAIERGHERVYGPKGLLQGDEVGMLVEGFDQIPAMGISYNFPYYDKLIKQAGFQKKYDYFSGYLDPTIGLSEKVKRGAEKVKERSGFWVRKFNSKEELFSISPELRLVYNSAFSGSEGFSPITEDEITLIAKRMLSIADPRLIKLVYKEDQIIGFLFSYPNICRGLQKNKRQAFSS